MKFVLLILLIIAGSSHDLAPDLLHFDEFSRSSGFGTRIVDDFNFGCTLNVNGCDWDMDIVEVTMYDVIDDIIIDFTNLIYRVLLDVISVYRDLSLWIVNMLFNHHILADTLATITDLILSNKYLWFLLFKQDTRFTHGVFVIREQRLKRTMITLRVCPPSYTLAATCTAFCMWTLTAAISMYCHPWFCVEYFIFIL